MKPGVSELYRLKNSVRKIGVKNKNKLFLTNARSWNKEKLTYEDIYDRFFSFFFSSYLCLTNTSAHAKNDYHETICTP